MKPIRIFALSAALAAQFALVLQASAAPIALTETISFDIGPSLQRSTRYQTGKTDSNVTSRTATAGNANEGATDYFRFYQKFTMPAWSEGFTLTSAVMAVTYQRLVGSPQHKLALYGTPADWDLSLRYNNAPRPSTDILAYLPGTRTWESTAYLDVTSFASQFDSGEQISFLFKSLIEGRNWLDVTTFSAQSLSLTFERPRVIEPPSPEEPGNPLPLPASAPLVLTGLALLAWRRRLPVGK